MKQNSPKPQARRPPMWMVWSIVLGVPAVVTLAGIMVGAHPAEIVVFSLLCLFSFALVFFYALGG